MTKKVTSECTQEDAGAALMAWYAEIIQKHPEGLISQAQAAAILGVSRMALSRLIGRGYICAEYFPKQPDIIGVSIGQDDPTWLKLIGWLSIQLGDDDLYIFPKACYVSFADVCKLWKSGDAKKKCKRDWETVMLAFKHPLDSKAFLKACSEVEKKMKGGENSEDNK